MLLIAESTGDKMIYAMSDIHGCVEALKDKMKSISLGKEDRIIFLGDYIDYGTNSGDVLRLLYNLQKEHGADRIIVLKGNHEAMLLVWIDEYKSMPSRTMELMSYDSWLKTDSELGYITYRTLVPEKQFEKLLKIERTASFAELNHEAVRILLESNGDLISWIRTMPLFYETESQIFVHAGVDEEAEEDWRWGTSDDLFLWKYPASTGKFYKDIIAGHIGTSGVKGDKSFHDIYYDGESHYYIDGSVYSDGKLLLLSYDEKQKVYYQIDGAKKELIS